MGLPLPVLRRYLHPLYCLMAVETVQWLFQTLFNAVHSAACGCVRMVYLAGARLLRWAWISADDSSPHGPDNGRRDGRRGVERNQIRSFLCGSERTRKPFLAAAGQIHWQPGYAPFAGILWHTTAEIKSFL